jgi:TolA-binding protein
VDAKAPRQPTPSAAESPKPSSASTYAVELGLLEPARQSIARGDFGGALGAIAQHQREFPRGQLTEEREALRVRALWGMGQHSQAESAANAFRKRYPRSGLLSWMKPAATTP